MLDWLTGNSELFGISVQNWMWVTGSGIMIYIALVLLLDDRHRRV
jgi:hypothetical protein